MTMQIRPIPVFLDSFGNPAINANVYISAPNTYPEDQSSQLIVTNAIDGAVLMQPIKTDGKGIAKNSNGQVAIPVITDDAYAIRVTTSEGGTLFAAQNVPSDAIGLSAGTAMADANFDTFTQAQALDLSEYDYIWIRSATGSTGDDWRGTLSGPGYGYISYRTGNVDPPSAGTGDYLGFYDSFGNEWMIDERSNLPLTNESRVSVAETDIATNASDIATNASDIAALQAIGVDVIEISSSGTWVKPSGYRLFEVSCVGGGGGGAGGNVSATSGGLSKTSGGGGGAGGMDVAYVSDADMPASVAVTIGVGGSSGGVPAVAGGNGGDTEFGLLAKALGGQGAPGTPSPFFGFGGNGGGTAGYIGNVAYSGGNGMQGIERPDTSTAGTRTYPGGRGGQARITFSSGEGGDGGALTSGPAEIVGQLGVKGIVIIKAYK